MKPIVQMPLDDLIRQFGVGGTMNLLAAGELSDVQAQTFVKRHLPDMSRDQLEGDRASRQTGQEHFDALTEAEQDALVGPETAAKIRAGDMTVADLYKPPENPNDFIPKPPRGD